MQKLVTIYLSESWHGSAEPEEHLEDYLVNGWRIVSVTPIGVGGAADFVVGWFAVLMEKKVVHAVKIKDRESLLTPPPIC